MSDPPREIHRSWGRSGRSSGAARTRFGLLGVRDSWSGPEGFSRTGKRIIVVALLVAIAGGAAAARSADFSWLLYRQECVKVTCYSEVGIGWRWTPRFGFPEPELRYRAWHPSSGTRLCEIGEQTLKVWADNGEPFILLSPPTGDGALPSFPPPMRQPSWETATQPRDAPWLESGLDAEEWWASMGGDVDTVP